MTAVRRKIPRDSRGRRTDRIKRAEIKQMEKRRREGYSPEEIAKEFKRDPRTVKKHLGLSDKADTEWLPQGHLRRLTEAADQLRNCLHNPHLELEPYIGTGQPLWLGGHDWALMPEEWVELTMPDFSDEALWGDTFPYLRQHLKESPFWKQADELKEMAEKLANDLDEAAGKFGKSDPGFSKSWQELQRGRSWITEVSRTPYKPVPDWRQIGPPYGDGYANRVCHALARGPLPDLYKRLWALVKKLAELNRDLTPDEVDRLLAAGACDYCKDLANRHP